MRDQSRFMQFRCVGKFLIPSEDCRLGWLARALRILVFLQLEADQNSSAALEALFPDADGRERAAITIQTACGARHRLVIEERRSAVLGLGVQGQTSRASRAERPWDDARNRTDCVVRLGPITRGSFTNQN